MSVSVIFKVYVDGERYLDEAEVVANLNHYRAGLLEWRHIGGLLISSPETTGTSLEIEEELRYLVEMICFRSLASLVISEPVNLRYWSFPGQLHLVPKNEYIYISGDYISEAKFLRAELLPALYQCGQRYISFLHQLAEGNPDFDPDTAILEAQATVARQALERPKLI